MDNLLDLWKQEFLVTDENGDGVPDHINVQVILPNGLRPTGLIDFCARLGYETTALSFDFLESNSQKEYTIEFVHSDDETSCLLFPEEKTIKFNYHSEALLSKLLSRLSGEWPEAAGDLTVVRGIYMDSDKWWVQDEASEERYLERAEASTYKKIDKKLKCLTDIWDGRGFFEAVEASPVNQNSISIEIDGNLSSDTFTRICYGAARIGMESTSFFLPITENPDPVLSFYIKGTDEKNAEISHHDNKVYIEGGEPSLSFALSYLFGSKHWSEGGSFSRWEVEEDKKETTDSILMELNWEGVHEKDELFRLYEEADKPSGDIEELRIYLSEPKKEREKISRQLQNLSGVRKVNVLSSYKPAVSWIRDDILPRLHTCGQIDSIDFYCQKETTPSGLELPIRWIQELYPVDEIISDVLNMDKDAIGFHLEESTEEQIKMVAKDKGGDVLLEESLYIPIAEMDYLHTGKKVYPVTNGIQWLNKGRVVKEVKFPTDREVFYNFYQSRFLPELAGKVSEETGGDGMHNPFFDHIEITAWMSEPEEALHVENERISSLEALHEDLYFNTLDYFHELGLQKQDTPFTAPGGVYPFMKLREGKKPKAKIRVFNREDRTKEITNIKGIKFLKGTKQPMKIVKESGEEKEVFQKKSQALASASEGVFPTWIPDVSYKGSYIPVYECFEPTDEDYISRKKLAVYKPTVMVEAGHHANEVSSTPAVLEWMEGFQADNLLRYMNIVIIPHANPDGKKIQERMAEEHPSWKHHAARYNAVGLEYAHLRYQKSIFGEANIVPSIMKKWAPDIVIDNHGIPSHEWVQPFAGYNSPPRFPVSYWLPNALIYGIGRKLQGDEYGEQRKILEAIQKNMQSNMKDTFIQKKNMEWMARYKKYGHDWLPDVFPVEQTDDLLFFNWKTSKDNSSEVAISRYPEWVSADFISEAADETVEGESLRECIESQKLFNQSIVESLKVPQEVSRKLKSGYRTIERERPVGIRGDIK